MRLIQASVRSTIQRLGSTTKPRTSLRFTIWSFQAPVRATSAHLGSGVAAIGDDAFDERKAPPRLPKQRFGAVAVLDIGGMDIDGMDIDVQQQALRVDEDVALAAEDLLPGIEAGRTKRAPPFTAPLALWASRIAVVGLASRPARSRFAT